MIFGQVPGYLGKKVSIEGDLNIFPNFTNIILNNSKRQTLSTRNHTEYYYNSSTGTYENQNTLEYYGSKKTIDKKNYMRWILKSSLAINYALSRKVDASIRFGKIYGNLLYKDDNFNNLNNVMFFEKNLKYQSSEFDFNFKFYKKNFIAPLGKYVLVGLGYSKMNIKNITGTLFNTIYNTNTYSIQEKTINHSAKFIKINLGFGNKIILKDYLYLTYSTEFNLYFLTGNENSFKQSDYLSVFKYKFNKNLSQNLLYDNLFNVKVGLGIIL